MIKTKYFSQGVSVLVATVGEKPLDIQINDFIKSQTQIPNIENNFKFIDIKFSHNPHYANALLIYEMS